MVMIQPQQQSLYSPYVGLYGNDDLICFFDETVIY